MSDESARSISIFERIFCMIFEIVDVDESSWMGFDKTLKVADKTVAQI